MIRTSLRLFVMLAAAAALCGCAATEWFTRPLEPEKATAAQARANAGRPPAAPERDPVRPGEKQQVGIHYDPNVFEANGSYNPDTLENMINSKGFDALTQHTFAEAGGDFDVDVNRNGQLMLFATTRWSVNPDIALQSVKSRAVTLLTNDPASDMMPKFHPREEQMAWCSNRYGNWDILVMPLKASPRTRPMQITFASDDEVHPAWSPDGKLLAYSRYNAMDGMWKIWVWDAATKTMSDITEGLFPEFRPVPDREPGVYTLAYQKHRRRDVPWYSIWAIKIRMDTTGAVEIASNPTEIVANDQWAAINPCWSPDGQYIAFSSVRKSPIAQWQARIYKADDVWVVREDGTDLTQITSHAAPDWSPCWAADSGSQAGRLYFDSLRNGRENIWSVRPIIAGMLAALGPESE